MAFKLYYDLLSQPSRALYIFLKTCNIPFESHLVNLTKGQHLTSEYEAVHPFNKVPAAEHNGFKMIERDFFTRFELRTWSVYSVAIIRYICREFNVPDHWYPKESKSQQKVDEYLEWQHLNTRLHCALYFRKKYLTPRLTGKPISEEKLKFFENNVTQTLDDLENIWLKEKNFLTGSKISVADIVASCEVEQLRVTGYDPHDGRPRIADWMKRVAEETSPYYQEAHIILNKLVNKEQGHKLKSKF